jgi:hypothetical protein
MYHPFDYGFNTQGGVRLAALFEGRVPHNILHNLGDDLLTSQFEADSAEKTKRLAESMAGQDNMEPREVSQW